MSRQFVPLRELNEDQYMYLKESGMLWEMYPEACGNYVEDVLEAENDIEELLDTEDFDTEVWE